ncbi:hypothetical protein [Variovorax sp. LjRoot178]|uniref:hypothetical protein n=1 Tax=Variovorax sp. LjRoot178 TaxID=3342277 RepID=UPI003ECC8932
MLKQVAVATLMAGFTLGAPAQGRIAIAGFTLGQKMTTCPPGAERKMDVQDGKQGCTFPPGARSVFGQPAQLTLVLDRNGEIDSIVATELADAKSASAVASEKLGEPNERNEQQPSKQGEWSSKWLRDDDVLWVAASPGFNLLTLSSLNGSVAQQAARAFSNAADDCLLDVRDRRLSFDRSRSCQAAKGLHLAYVKVDKYTEWANTTKVPLHAYLVSEARGVLWTAVAISNAHHGSKRTALW